MRRYLDLREYNNLKQSDIAKLLKIDRTTYLAIEKEYIDISTDNLCKLAKYYNVSTDYLLGNTNELKPHKLIRRSSKNRLRQLRLQKKLTQKELGKKINMSQTGYSQYEVGTTDISNNMLLKLSDFYKVSIDYILYRTDDKTKYNEITFNIDEKDR